MFYIYTNLKLKLYFSDQPTTVCFFQKNKCIVRYLSKFIITLFLQKLIWNYEITENNMMDLGLEIAEIVLKHLPLEDKFCAKIFLFKNVIVKYEQLVPVPAKLEEYELLHNLSVFNCLNVFELHLT